MQARTHDGRAFRMLTVIDEFTRECLAIDVARRLTSEDVLERLSDLFIHRGVPGHIRSDNGAEFTATRIQHRPATQLTRLPTPGARGRSSLVFSLRCAPRKDQA